MAFTPSRSLITGASAGIGTALARRLAVVTREVVDGVPS